MEPTMHRIPNRKDRSPAELLPDTHPQKLRPLPEIGPNGRTVTFRAHAISGTGTVEYTTLVDASEPRITRTRRWSDAAKAVTRFLAWGLAAILLTVIVAAFAYRVGWIG
jgi:hypothetical protein